jgi:hypothetical protein
MEIKDLKPLSGSKDLLNWTDNPLTHFNFRIFAWRIISMRVVLCIFFFAGWISGFTQNEDFTDYRRKSENFARVYDKDIRSDLASFAIGGIDESLGKSPLKKMPVNSFGADSICFENGPIRITIKGGVFDPSRHKLIFENKHLVKIDNKPYFGDYGKVPTTRILSLTITNGKDTIPVPAGAVLDLYNPSFVFRDGSGVARSQDAVYISADSRRLYIYMLNKDDAGSYEVTWILQDKQYLRRVIDFGFSK